MFTKFVKFKNGKFGVRRYCFLIGHEFYGKDWWWPSTVTSAKEQIEKHAQYYTLDQAKEAYETWLKKDKIDIGTEVYDPDCVDVIR